MIFLQHATGSVEPVSVAEAKEACRIDDGLDAYLLAAVVAARQQAEQITGRCYRGQVLRKQFTGWPTEPLELHAFNASAVTVSYRSAAQPDQWTVLGSTVYRWGASGNRTAVRLADGQSWPDLATEDWGERVRIDVTVAPLGTIPDCVRLYILAGVTAWADNPGAMIDGRIQTNPLHERLLDGERLWG